MHDSELPVFYRKILVFFSLSICTNHVNKSALVPFMRVYEVNLQNRCCATDDFENFSSSCFVLQLPWLSCTKANRPHSRLTYDMHTCYPFLHYTHNLFEHVNDCEKYKKIEILKRAIFFLLFRNYRGKFRYVLNLSTVLHMTKSRFPVNKTTNQSIHPHPCLICRTLSQTV